MMKLKDLINLNHLDIGSLDFKNIDFNNLDFKKIGTWQIELKIIVLTIIFVASLLLGYILLIKNNISGTTDNETKVSQLKDEYKEKYLQSLTITDYQQQLSTITNNFLSLKKQIPSSAEIADLLEDITFAAESSNLEVISIIPKKQASEEFLLSYDLYISLSGTYNDFGEFTSKITKLDRIVNIETFILRQQRQINMNEAEQQTNVNQEPKLEAELTAKTYWFPSDLTGAGK